MKSKQQKRDEALVRAQARAAQSDADKLEWLDRMGYRALKERAQLLKRLDT